MKKKPYEAYIKLGDISDDLISEAELPACEAVILKNPKRGNIFTRITGSG